MTLPLQHLIRCTVTTLFFVTVLVDGMAVIFFSRIVTASQVLKKKHNRAQ